MKAKWAGGYLLYIHPLVLSWVWVRPCLSSALWPLVWQGFRTECLVLPVRIEGTYDCVLALIGGHWHCHYRHHSVSSQDTGPKAKCLLRSESPVGMTSPMAVFMTQQLHCWNPLRWSATVRVAGDTAVVCKTVGIGAAVWLHMLLPHQTLGELHKKIYKKPQWHTIKEPSCNPDEYPPSW